MCCYVLHSNVLKLVVLGDTRETRKPSKKKKKRKQCIILSPPTCLLIVQSSVSLSLSCCSGKGKTVPFNYYCIWYIRRGPYDHHVSLFFPCISKGLRYVLWGLLKGMTPSFEQTMQIALQHFLPLPSTYFRSSELIITGSSSTAMQCKSGQFGDERGKGFGKPENKQEGP